MRAFAAHLFPVEIRAITEIQHDSLGNA